MQLVQHLPLGVEVAQVVRRDRAEVVEKLAGQLDFRGQVVAVSLDQVAEHVSSVEPHGADPRQVVESHLVHPQARDVHPEQLGEPTLEGDRYVA